MQGAQRHQVDLVAEQVGQLVGELFDFPSQPSPRAQRVQDVDVAVWPAVPRAREPKTLSSAIPYLSQMAARRPSSTSTPGMITMFQG